MIEFKNVGVSFKEKGKVFHAVKDVSFTIKDKDIFGIVGGSGAGKSTLLRTINSLQPISSGHVIVNNKDISSLKHKDLREARKNIGMIFQHFNLAHSKTVFQNIAFSLEEDGWSKTDIDKRVTELLKFVNLLDKKDQYPSRLSGGQKQRVAIARALANNSKILLCDEPTSALDTETTGQVLKLLKEVNEKLGVTIVIITHQLEVVKEICNKAVVMKDGQVVEEGDVYEIFTNPKDSFTQHLISHQNNFKLPSNVLENVTGDIYKLTYKGSNATDAILTESARLYDVNFNILHGRIEYISGKPLGILYVNITGDIENIQKVVHNLETKIYKIEEVK